MAVLRTADRGRADGRAAGGRARDGRCRAGQGLRPGPDPPRDGAAEDAQREDRAARRTRGRAGRGPRRPLVARGPGCARAVHAFYLTAELVTAVLASARFSEPRERTAVTEGILDGKLALVAGVANKRSIAWAIAQALHGAGARLAFTYQGDRLEDSVRKLAETVGSDVVVPCDESIEAAFDQLGERLGGLDILAHSIAFAPAESFEGRFIDTSRHAFVTALDISAYSMVAMARSAEPLMAPRGGGAMVTLTYMASE